MHDGTKTTFNKGFFDSNDWSGFSELYDSAATCEKMALIIEKIITKEIDKGVNKTLGKPVMILRITTDNHCEWLRNKPLKPIMHTMRDLYTLYKQKKITLRFISTEEENNFKKNFLKK